jgi:tetratricopeptide (TPR) repeat protein
MNPRIFPAAIALVATCGFARGDESFASLADRSMAEMNANQWPEALATLEKIIATFGGEDVHRTIGPQFGTIWFRKGLCEMKLRKWTEAAGSFETCYRKFPNPTPAGSNVNAFQKRALLKWGEAAMGAAQWELALTQFRRFLDERDKVTDTYPAGAFYLNVAVCNYKLGRIAPGNLNLEIAINSKDTFPTPDAGIVAGFEAFVGTAIAAKNERIILDFIRKNRGGITFEPCEMGTFSANYMKLGADAFAAGMPAAAIAIYQLVPSSEAVIDDLRARIAAMGPLAEIRNGTEVVTKKSLEERLAAMEADYHGPSSAEVIKLAATALIHERHGNLRGAHAAYGQLIRYFPAAARREDYLFNSIRLGIELGEPKESIAETTGKLIQEFPGSANTPAARELSLASLFESGKYGDALKLAEESLAGMKEGSPGHDLCLHVLGGSLYYTGQNAKAKPFLDEHVAKYPASPRALAARYFQASNLSKLRAFDEALPLLDAFIAKYPTPGENPFLPFALYDRAAANFADGAHAESLNDLGRLNREFPASPVSDTALTLEGNILRATSRPEEAKAAYLKALDFSGRRGNESTTAEVLSNLVSLLAASSPKEAVTFADRFWKDFGKSPLAAQVAVAQMEPMATVNRGDEALERLAAIIPSLAKSDRSYTLESAVNAYAAAFLAKHSPEQLLKHFDAFPGIEPEDKATRALLRMSAISAFEHVAKTSTDADARLAARTRILALFQELKASISPKELPTPILLKLADHLRSNTSAPREALPFYEEAISRNEALYRFPSLFGRGDTWARSTSPEELQKGIDDFESIYKQSKNRAEREYALFRMIETRVAKGDYANVIKDANTYSDPKNRFVKFAPEIGLFVARSHQETGDLDAAIDAYSSVWSTPEAPVRLTAFAIKTWMELLWNRNKPDDRKVALESGGLYLEATRPLAAEMSAEESKLWQEIEKLVQTYSADPSVK